LIAVKNELAWYYHNARISANAPERARIEQRILDAEYAIETATSTPPQSGQM
jgi:hypothetical protein